jgi:hypothetical protein
MAIKVHICLPEKKSVSYLTQLASVLFFKDSIMILKETVHAPIGGSVMQVMVAICMTHSYISL